MEKRPRGRPRLDRKFCPVGHELRRGRNGQWRSNCPTCGAARLAEHNERQRARANTPEAQERKRAAMREKARRRQQRRSADPEYLRRDADRKAMYRTTAAGFLAMVRDNRRQRSFSEGL